MEKVHIQQESSRQLTGGEQVMNRQVNVLAAAGS